MSSWQRTRRQAAGWALLSAVAAVACASLLRAGVPRWARPVVALLPVMPMVQYCRLMLRGIREMDELQARIQLEGAVYGLLGCALAIMAGGLLTSSGILPPFSLGQAWPWLWTIAFVSWAAGSGFAGRRYR